jgi:hypothetical protein
MFMSRHQTAGQSNYISVANKSFEKVVKYLESTLTDQKCIHEEIMSRLNSGNACYHAVQKLLDRQTDRSINRFFPQMVDMLPVQIYVYTSYIPNDPVQKLVHIMSPSQ